MTPTQTTPTSRFPSNVPTAIPLILAVLLIASTAWAITGQIRVGDANDRATSLEAEVDLLRQQANATSYVLAPTADAPPNANGMAFFALNGSGVISVANLEPLPEGRAYQVWYYPAPDVDPLPGATIAIDSAGTGFTLIPADVGLFTDVSVSIEPAAGTTVPSGPVVLTGSTGGARG